ncbi:hypothetical protein [Thermotoga sp.]|uniref:hypothetical protein n=1 Tax=Thermotoga sp. TaxID=28240 RepID=UPI0025F0C3FA|nr:hypothetical protein [Thermotoga sp.]MCD6550880.1 hypothetical protein [Thermotoga sp.]
MKYLLLFLATFLFDNSGTPLPILAASTLISAGKMRTLLAFPVIYLGLLSWDSLTFFAGKALKPLFSKLKWKVFQKILKEFLNVYISTEKILVPFCKFVPWVGKFTPFLAGYIGRRLETLLVIWVGDLFYESVFFFSALMAGRVFFKYSKLFGIVLFAVMMVLYAVWKKRAKKVVNRSKNSI